MRILPRTSPTLRQLSAGLLLASLLALGACSDDPDRNSPMGGDGPSSGLDAGTGNGGNTPVTMVPSSDQRNEADPGVVTKPQAKNDKPQSFTSDLTKQASSGAGRGSATAAGGLGGAVSDSSSFGGLAPPTATGAPVTTEAGKSGEAERAIVEADIVQVSGNKLYALSQYGGMSVIDIADPAKLRLLGRYRELTGTPFEMYLRDSIAIVMFTSWGEYTKQSDGSYLWVQTSKIVALDAGDPAAIKAVGSFDIPGEVSDSRVVGDVMYVVGYQNGSCWNCKENSPLTSVLSLNIADPHAIKRVDSLELLGNNNSYGGGKRSISVNTQRIYIAGPEYGSQQPSNSTIQVVDISDAGGDLVEGTTVKVAGQITNRWQMDEYQNVLRVISQPFPWWSGTQAATVVQTYTVTSSQQISALGRTTLQVPPNETLRTVRFDGTRGYAITAQQTDPLITIDLSNAAQPRQVGELVMPGWVYYLEPRGTRVIGLGYDQNNTAGGITVSIFDVTNLAAPKMLSRVNFGGTWASLPEDQDRIHKAFKVLDQQGLITVPFSGWSDSRRGDIYCSGQYKSGIQLVDFQGDTLTARGIAPSRGQARRAIVNGNTLLSVSDEAVDSFDIANRQSPAALGRLTIAQNVTHAFPLTNGHVARIVQDWYGGQRSTIDVIPLADVDRPDGAVGELDLSKVLAPADACSGNAYIEQAFVSGNEIDLLTTRWDYNGGNYTTSQGVVVIDASDPKAPKLVSKLEWTQQENGKESPWYAFYNYFSYGFMGPQQNILRSENAIVRLEQRYLYVPNAVTSTYEVRISVIDLSDPKNPSQTTLALPKASGYGGLVADGKDVLFSHFDEIENGARARFYLDRIDLTNPKAPKLGDKISVPGTLLHYDRARERALTSELTRSTVKDLTSQQCYDRFGYAEWIQNGTPDGGYIPYDQNAKGTCSGYTEHLHLIRFVTGGAVLESSYHLGDSERVSASSMGDGRVTAVLNYGYGGYLYGPAIGIVDCFDCGGFGRGIYRGGVSKPAEVVVLGGFDSGTLDVGRLTVDDDSSPWWGFYGSPPVYATGTRALVQSSSDVAIVDTSVPSDPKIVSKVPLFGSASDLQAAGKLVLLSLGMNGVQRIDL